MLEGKRILVVDDEFKIIEVIKLYLEKEGCQVFQALDGKQALEVYNKINPDFIILDLMLPDINGEEICKIIRKQSRVPIIMLTAKVDESEVIAGLYMGADDYITKPFSVKELIARMIVVLRRVSDETVPLTDMISLNGDDLVVDALKREVRKNGELVYVTLTEFNVLMTLLKYPNKTFTRDELMDLALGEDNFGYNRVVDTHIKNLRQKIESNPKEPRYIITVHGTGYRFGGE
jgi:DNA-binding response OmpR family regulator